MMVPWKTVRNIMASIPSKFEKGLCRGKAGGGCGPEQLLLGNLDCMRHLRGQCWIRESFRDWLAMEYVTPIPHGLRVPSTVRRLPVRLVKIEELGDVNDQVAQSHGATCLPPKFAQAHCSIAGQEGARPGDWLRG